jgi:hypothetical protein
LIRTGEGELFKYRIPDVYPAVVIDGVATQSMGNQLLSISITGFFK